MTDETGVGIALDQDRGAAPGDPGPPYLLVDLYEKDLGSLPPWTVLATTPHYFGAIIKATEGTGYAPRWFNDNWRALRSVVPGRYGSTWFRGCYHFLRLCDPGAEQAEYYLQAVERAGGWGAGDIVPIVDVELGGERNPNRRASVQQIIDNTTAFAERVNAEAGRRVMLYGRGAMRDLGIRDRMGCSQVWNPSYTASMHMAGLEAWTVDDVALWQFGGDGVGDASRHLLPLKVPGFGAIDVSVFVDGAKKPTLARLKERLL